MAATSYAGAFGTDTEQVSAQDLVALAGWAPPVTGEQAAGLRRAAAGAADCAGFVTALGDEIEIGATWVEAFVDSADGRASRTTERLIS